MNTLIVHPKTQAQEKAVKAVLEALDIAFEKVDDVTDPQEIFILPPNVLDAVKKSEEQIRNGQFYTYNQVKEILAKK